MRQLESLWPEIDTPEDTSPKIILEYQAAELAKATRNRLRATVEASMRVDWVYLSLYLGAPALGKYQYLLITFRHRVDGLYPVERIKPGSSTAVTDTYDSEDGFIAGLAKALREDETLRVLKTLLAQSKSA